MTKRRAGVLGVALAGASFLAISFLHAAGTRARAMRAEACNALKPQAMTKVQPGQEAPDFQLADATGKRWSLKSLRGQAGAAELLGHLVPALRGGDAVAGEPGQAPQRPADGAHRQPR